jgi:DNA-binding LacI/PurR family transcriptional regulator
MKTVVLNGRQPLNGGISEDTRQRALEAAKERGYRRDAVVRAARRHLWIKRDI